MILIFDYFETIVHNKSMDFNRGLKDLWEEYYKDKCSFEEISKVGEELFEHLLKMHEQGLEYRFVKDELPEYAARYGGDTVEMSPEEEATFLMKCNKMEVLPSISEALAVFEQMGIPMYVLSNSGFTADALSVALERLGIRKYFKKVWSSADFGKIKPNREFFEMAITSVLSDNSDATKEDIIFVGDMYETDVRGANSAGIDVIWLNYKNESNKDNLYLHSINSTDELLDFIKTLV